ncbi:hypothetical protein ELH91_25420 (plasmid) [Rhizobium leguminosarum]|uniref:hypothetical protein n=1 Tax=Rhizobium leguminosarum TaxID=384 RepID=UPI00103107B7|nr:hypothetical protein [Rhizobium leguminosarum]TAY08561.1 hypothetical protein ELH91_25420 [Rhizobium leguminosarum]
MADQQKKSQTRPPAQKFAEPSSGYLHPYACFKCRKSFKRAAQPSPVLPCPECGGPSIGLTRKFKPPKRSDIRQWGKVEALVRHGFLFCSLPEPYPTDRNEVEAFAKRHAHFLQRERERFPEAYAEIEAALSIHDQQKLKR